MNCKNVTIQMKFTFQMKKVI